MQVAEQSTTSTLELTVAVASTADRHAMAGFRHDVYAEELGRITVSACERILQIVNDISMTKAKFCGKPRAIHCKWC